jgi:hypothetical protein
MNKQQRLRNAAEGFMAGLVANGYTGPFRYSNLDWELPFYRAWDRWEPPRRNRADFPSFRLGGARSTSEPREMLWQLKRTSPFNLYASERLPTHPMGLTAEEYLEIWAKGADPTEWIALGADFLDELGKRFD